MKPCECEPSTIYASYYPKILGYLSRMVGEAEAEDLAQEVFIKAGRGMAGFRGDSQVSTWLYRIAANTARDALRSRSWRYDQQNPGLEELVDSDCELEERDALTGEGAPAVEQQVVREEMGTCLQGYIARLPETLRAVLLLSDQEGFSNADIAQILGISLETVKIRLHRGREKLREELASHCEYYWASELGWRIL